MKEIKPWVLPRDELRQWIADERAKGIDLDVISEDIGISLGAAGILYSEWQKEFGKIKAEICSPNDERQVIYEERLRVIHALRARGEADGKIAAKLGISSTMVRRISLREAHVLRVKYGDQLKFAERALGRGFQDGFLEDVFVEFVKTGLLKDGERPVPKLQPARRITMFHTYSPQWILSLKEVGIHFWCAPCDDRFIVLYVSIGSPRSKEAIFGILKCAENLTGRVLIRERAQDDGSNLEAAAYLADPVPLGALSVLNLSARALNCLYMENIYFVGDLVERTERELLKFTGLGRKCLCEIKEALARRDLCLRQ